MILLYQFLSKRHLCRDHPILLRTSHQVLFPWLPPIIFICNQWNHFIFLQACDISRVGREGSLLGLHHQAFGGTLLFNFCLCPSIRLSTDPGNLWLIWFEWFYLRMCPCKIAGYSDHFFYSQSLPSCFRRRLHFHPTLSLLLNFHSKIKGLLLNSPKTERSWLVIFVGCLGKAQYGPRLSS